MGSATGELDYAPADEPPERVCRVKERARVTSRNSGTSGYPPIRCADEFVTIRIGHFVADTPVTSADLPPDGRLINP